MKVSASLLQKNKVKTSYKPFKIPTDTLLKTLQIQ